MKKAAILFWCIVWAVGAFASISISSPANNSSQPNSVHFVLSATPQAGTISGVEIDVDSSKKYYTKSSKIDTSIWLSSGTRQITVKAWDTHGNLQKAYRTITVSSSTSAPTNTSSTTSNWSDIEEMSGWQQCSACAGVGGDGPVASYWMAQHRSSPSIDGNSTEFFLGGSTPYSNVLFSKRLSGDASFIRTKRHFIYDLYFYYKNADAAQALEFDINQYIDGKFYLWGTQCNVRAGHSWDIWDNINKHWIDTGIYCPTPPAYSWNHVVLEMERTSDSKVHYISITFNGTKHYLNRYYTPRSTSWTGLTLNYQMDGNAHQTDYSTWVDNFKFSAW